MALIQQTVDFGAAPADLKPDAGIERGEDAPDRVERQLVEVATLDPRNLRLRDVGRAGQIHLAPDSPPAQGTNDQADSPVVHRPSVTRSA